MLVGKAQQDWRTVGRLCEICISVPCTGFSYLLEPSKHLIGKKNSFEIMSQKKQNDVFDF